MNNLFRSKIAFAIFGFYARNRASTESDLDVLVEVDGKIGSRFIDLAIELEEILGVKVDLVSKHGIKEKYYSLIEPELLYPELFIKFLSSNKYVNHNALKINVLLSG